MVFIITNHVIDCDNQNFKISRFFLYDDYKWITIHFSEISVCISEKNSICLEKPCHRKNILNHNRGNLVIIILILRIKITWTLHVLLLVKIGLLLNKNICEQRKQTNILIYWVCSCVICKFLQKTDLLIVTQPYLHKCHIINASKK